MASGTAVFVRQGRALAEVMAPRTAAIDEAIERAAHRQVVLVGAGLDGRPWRLASLREATAFSVDHPASQADARARSAEPTPAGRLVFVPVDLATERLDPALAGAGHDASAPVRIDEDLDP